MISRETVQELMSLPNVVAVGEGFKISGGVTVDLRCVVVSVAKKLPRKMLKYSERVPDTVEDMHTDVVETGVIRALDVDRKGKIRPVPGGVSCGHGDITAGTWACLVARDGHVYGLSNNHVLANSNDAEIGDKIYQPGPFDAGEVTDDLVIAYLYDFVPIAFDGSETSDCPVALGVVSVLNAIAKGFKRKSRIPGPVLKQGKINLVDVALARPIDLSQFVARVLGVGMLSGVGEVSLGDTVKKSGRTTGVTQSTVTQVNVTCKVQYGEGKTATFEDQVMAGAMSQGGDSGSAVLDDDNAFVGLLFAGSDSVTIFSSAENVMKELKLEGVV